MLSFYSFLGPRTVSLNNRTVPVVVNTVFTYSPMLFRYSYWKDDGTFATLLTTIKPTPALQVEIGDYGCQVVERLSGLLAIFQERPGNSQQVHFRADLLNKQKLFNEIYINLMWYFFLLLLIELSLVIIFLWWWHLYFLWCKKGYRSCLLIHI